MVSVEIAVEGVPSFWVATKGAFDVDDLRPPIDRWKNRLSDGRALIVAARCDDVPAGVDAPRACRWSPVAPFPKRLAPHTFEIVSR